jgi:hypothetical protein
VSLRSLLSDLQLPRASDQFLEFPFDGCIADVLILQDAIGVDRKLTNWHFIAIGFLEMVRIAEYA